MVDARGEELVIRPEPSLDRGTALVIAPDGKVQTFELGRQVDLIAAIQAVVSQGGS